MVWRQRRRCCTNSLALNTADVNTTHAYHQQPRCMTSRKRSARRARGSIIDCALFQRRGKALGK